MKKNYIYFIALLISTVSFGQSVLMLEEFDDKIGYTVSSAEYLTSRTEYFTQTNDASDIDGTFPDWDGPLFAVQQISANNSITISATIPVGMTDLTFVAGLGEGDAPDGFEDWDLDDKAIFEYRLDSGTWIEMFTVQGTGTDTAPMVNGVEVTSVFEEGTRYDIGDPGLASTIDIRVLFEGLTDAGEDLALDFLAIADQLDNFPGVDVSLPGGDVYPNGTTSVDVEYTITTNSPDRVDIWVNDLFVTNGNTELGTHTYSVVTENEKNYIVAVGAFLGTTEIDGYEVEFSVTNTASIGKNEIEGFAVYPNPVNTGSFKINSSNGSIKNVQLYDTLGKQLLNKTIQRNENIDVSNLNAGIYILKVEEKGKVATRKLIIN